MTYRVTHIRKPDANSSVEHITHIKAVNNFNQEFIRTVEQVIADLKRGDRYYVRVGANEIDVIYEKASGREYIKTKSDGTTRDNLLSLPQF